MRPKVIMHNTISLDGSLSGFEVDMGLHYRIAASFGAQAHLIGSRTLLTGVELFYDEVPPETAEDRERPPAPTPTDEKVPPIWVIPDSRGTLQGLLHLFRRYEHCRDVVLLVTDKTPEGYLAYLDERGYDHHQLGADRVDLGRALELLAKRYAVKTVLVDAGGLLNAVLLEQGLVDQISLIVAPRLVGTTAHQGLFQHCAAIELELLRRKTVDEGACHLIYRVGGDRP
jgi:2,5-diamino-6-(ribosylamino)-4(3H)-pyrimidinone 5'-phosphate reductase